MFHNWVKGIWYSYTFVWSFTSLHSYMLLSFLFLCLGPRMQPVIIWFLSSFSLFVRARIKRRVEKKPVRRIVNISLHFSLSRVTEIKKEKTTTTTDIQWMMKKAQKGFQEETFKCVPERNGNEFKEKRERKIKKNSNYSFCAFLRAIRWVFYFAK